MPAHPEQAPRAKACVATFRAAAAYDVIWVSLGSGGGGIPRVALLDDPAYEVLFAGPYPVRASGPRIVETFLEIGLFPFLPPGILGDPRPPAVQRTPTPHRVVAARPTH